MTAVTLKPRRGTQIKLGFDLLEPHAYAMDEFFRMGAQDGLERRPGPQLGIAKMLYADHRVGFGFEHRDAPLLTWPLHQHKLKKGKVPTYGTTLQQYISRLRDDLIVNMCPKAGECAGPCVVKNGHGERETVQRGRRSKTAFLLEQPRAFSYKEGYELGQALGRHLTILWRPNVASDLPWEQLIPSAFDGSALGSHICAYDYTKLWERVADTDGWVAKFYRVSYSWNEDSHLIVDEVQQFLNRGGSVAMVTSRKKGGDLIGFDRLAELGLTGLNQVVDADLTDEWMFGRGVIGDLSAKGRARKLIGKGGFVVTI